MVNMKWWSISLGFREIQMNITMTDHHIPIRMTKIKRLTTYRADKDVALRELPYTMIWIVNFFFF